MLTVTKIFEFEAAHYLPNYEGDCNRHHGHSYKLEVTVKGPFDSNQGMIVDFKGLKDIVKTSVIDHLDHQMLNDVIPNPTAEALIRWIKAQLSVMSGPYSEIKVVRIKLWETSSSYCEWTAD
jgi:6-pyruvoyltetrahydropterin/6-carboxytetrahydropterin synthase